MLKYHVIGSHIRNARLRLGLSQENAANQVGISATYYGKIERGDIRPNLERLAEICEVLSVPIETVFYGASSTMSSMANAPPTDEEFIVLIKQLSECASAEKKAMMIRICREIATSDLKS